MVDARLLHLSPCAGSIFGPGAVNFTLDGSTDAAEWVFKAPHAITITRLGFRYGVRTGTPPTFKISLQGVSASGVPNGTIKGGGSPASATFTPPANSSWDGLWQWITLDNSYVCSRGEDLSIVIAYDSGTIDASNNSSFTTDNGGTDWGWMFPYAIHNSAGSRSVRSSEMWFGYGSASKAYGRPFVSNSIPTNRTSATSPDEVGTKFTLPAEWGDTFQVVGIRYLGLTADGPFNVKLYDGTTVLQDLAMGTDWRTSGGQRWSNSVFFDEATLATLTFGATYRVSLLPGSGCSLNFPGIGMASPDDKTAYPLGPLFSYTHRTDAGSWTDDDATIPLIDLILDDVAEPTGGGGLLQVAGMTGGMQLT